ncbi:MAG: pectinesterase family protein [Clostridiales bacterium]|nr:pectinesterase family protein [Clostridiales bacterium]
MFIFKLNGLKRAVSLVLSVLMVLSAFNAVVYADETITYGKWTIVNIGDKSSGSGTATMEVEEGNVITYVSPSSVLETYGTNGDYYCVHSTGSNGSASNGIVTTSGKGYAYYKPTTAGTLTLRVRNADSARTLVVSKTSESGTSSAICSFIGDGSDLSETVTGNGYTASFASSMFTIDVEVETEDIENGCTYYVCMTGSKMGLYDPSFVPYVTVSGTISGEALDEYNIRFTNKTTGDAKDATVSGNTYSIVLKPGYDYTAGLYGSYATAYAVSTATKTVSVASSTSNTQTADLTIEKSVSYYASGSISGFASGYDVSDLGLVFTPGDTTSFETVNAEIDKTALTYSAQLAANETYTVSLSGAYDYELSGTYTVSNDTAEGVTLDITLAAVPTYAVSGSFLGLTQVRGEYETLSVTPSAITFTNVDDKYTYSGTAADAAYSVYLRDGSYLASITSDSYSTSTHVVVDGGAVSRNLLLKDETTKSVEYAETLYVGSDKAYKTVQSAVDAVTNMTRTDGQRVTIMLDPGTYREQVVVNTPNITFKGTGSSRDKTTITWYYGIGYKYYSCVDSYYNPYADYDKFEKGDAVSYWGSAVITNRTAAGFKAENITFENSFNKYMTDEEISDGVEVNGLQSITTVRKETTNVDTRAATERAAAYVNYADQVEFYNCAFIGSQDTLYTCNYAYDSYYRNCYIEGQTDFIYGNGDVIFDGCELNLCGYDGTEASAYITANSCSEKYPADYGYIFRSCYILYNSERDTAASYFGRMWGDSAKVAFVNTQLQESDMILSAGWTDMSVSATSSLVTLREFNTTYDGTEVDTSGRVNGTGYEYDSSAYSVENVFINNGWTPSYYETDSTTAPAFSTAPTLSSNGDLNKPNPGETVTVSYEIDQNGDASRISWYGVSYEGTDITAESLDTLLSTATLLYTSSAVSSNSYQISTACTGLYLLAVVTPITNYGLEGGPGYVLVYENTVSDTWSDPDNPGSIAPGSGINIYLAGDSTVKDYSAKGMYNNGAILSAGSWGEFLQEFFDEDYVQVNNYAQGGRACRSFLNEGKLDSIMENIKAGDYLLMQFGHNDSANGASYYEDRFVPLYTQDSLPTSSDRSSGFPTIKPTEDMKSSDGTYAWNCGATYKGFLQEYIDRALEKGAIPVIVSPVARMYYNSDGTIKTHHDAGTDYALTADYYTTNNAYVTACEELYQENIDAGNTIYYIDAFQYTVDLFETAYSDCGSNVYGAAIMDYDFSTSKIDSTHSNKTGGMIQAGIIAKWMQDADISLSDYVEQPVTVYGEETSGDYIFTIADKVFTAKDKNLVEYPYWSNIGQEIFDSIGGASSVVYVDLDFSSEDSLALYETNADTTFTDGVYSGRYTNDSSQTFDVSVYQNGIQYFSSTAGYGTKMTAGKPVFSFVADGAGVYTVTASASTGDGTLNMYSDSGCTTNLAEAADTETLTYTKTDDTAETIYVAASVSNNLYVKSFTISSEKIPVEEPDAVTLSFNTDEALALYETNAASTFTDGEYSGVYTNSSGQEFEATVYSSGIQYYSSQIKYGTKATAGKVIFSFTADKAAVYTVSTAIGTGSGNVNLYSDSACTTAVATAAAGSDITYTKTSSEAETLYFASSDVNNLYLTEISISYVETSDEPGTDVNSVTLDFNTDEALALYETNADSTFTNGEYSGVYTNSDGQEFETTVYSSGIKYFSSNKYYGTFATVGKPIFSFVADGKAMYTVTASGNTGSGTLNLYTDAECANSVASGDAPGSAVYKKQDDTTETLYVAASVSSNMYVTNFTIAKEDLPDETKTTYTGAITGIETDDANVELTLTCSTEKVTVSASDYVSTGIELIDGETYEIIATGDYGVYTGSITADGSGTANIVLSRIEFDFPLDLSTNFNLYNTYLSTVGYGGSSDITDHYSGITVHPTGMNMYTDYYGAKTNSYSIISFDADVTGKITVAVGVTASNSDTLQLLVNGEAATDALAAAAKATTTLTAYVTAGDTVTLYTPTRSNLYYKTIDVEYAAKTVKTIGGIRYIIFGVDEDQAANSSSFNIRNSSEGNVTDEETSSAASFDTVYGSVQFDDENKTQMTAQEILGEGAKYVVAFRLSDDDAGISDDVILDGLDISFNN